MLSKILTGGNPKGLDHPLMAGLKIGRNKMIL
ncbi:hypothetical protein J2X76_002743 [Neorhizobium sp. 2083]|nr:hypothetical protein [Neorhizobium sp. 2083]